MHSEHEISDFGFYEIPLRHTQGPLKSLFESELLKKVLYLQMFPFTLSGAISTADPW